MAHEPRTIPIDENSEIARLLDAARLCLLPERHESQAEWMVRA